MNMKISKTAQKWLNNLVQELNTLRNEAASYKDCVIFLKDEWINARQSGEVTSAGRATWKEYNNAEKKLREMTSRIEYLTKITGVLEGKPLYANEIMYSDVNPYEVIEMKTDKTWVVRAMKAEIKEDAKKELQDSFIPGGFVGHFDNNKQDWNITSDENGAVRTIRFHNSKTSKGWFDDRQRFAIQSAPSKFYDYNF